MSARALAAEIREGRVSARSATEAVLVRIGAILVGKTTTPEFAYDSFTQSPLWGKTRNLCDLAGTPGGSSGGSVRIPASFCGLVGLKPSLGRIPMDIVGIVFD